LDGRGRKDEARSLVGVGVLCFLQCISYFGRVTGKISGSLKIYVTYPPKVLFWNKWKKKIAVGLTADPDSVRKRSLRA